MDIQILLPNKLVKRKILKNLLKQQTDFVVLVQSSVYQFEHGRPVLELVYTTLYLQKWPSYLVIAQVFYAASEGDCVSHPHGVIL